MLIMARLLNNLRMEISPVNYEPTIYATPLPNLGREFRVRVVEKRQNVF